MYQALKVMSFLIACSYPLMSKSFTYRRFIWMSTKSIVFLGTPDVVASTVLKTLHSESTQNNKFIISAAVTQPPAISGRKKQLVKSPVHTLAESLSIKVFYPEKANDPVFLEELEKLSPDLCITAAYGNYLPKKFLSIPKLGTINIHPSLLPAYRGAAPIQRCLENGDSETGVTILETVSKMDAGPILYQYKQALNGHETSTQMLHDMFTIGTKELIGLLPSVFDGSAVRVEQNEALVTFANKLNMSEARVDFSVHDALTVHNRLRGFADWPGVWTAFQIYDSAADSVFEDNIRIKMITTVVLQPASSPLLATPASLDLDARTVLLEKDPVHGYLLRVRCARGSVLGVTHVQPSGKKVMPVRDYMNGLRGNKLLWTVPPLDS